MKVRARAIRRCGELLKAMAPKDTPGRPKENYTDNSTISRSQAAEEAGLSKRQKDTALRLAAIPEDEFEEAVESEDPPTVTELAEQGTVKHPKPLLDLQGRAPREFSVSTQVQGELQGVSG